MNRRLLTLFVLGAVAVGLLFAHPYLRQALFGPQLQGQPLCVWQQRYRRVALGPEANPGLRGRLLHHLGLAGANAEETAPWVKDPALLPLLLSLKDDPVPDVRRQVAWDLGAQPIAPAAVNTLLDLLDDPAREVRRAAGVSLAEYLAFHDPEQAAPLLRPARPRLEARLTDPDQSCRVFAALALLRTFGDTATTVPVFAAALDSSVGVPGYELDGLVEAGEAGAEVIWRRSDLMTDSHREVRWQYAEALAACGPRAVPRLVRLADDPEALVRRGAAESLGMLGHAAREAAPTLRRLSTADADAEVREAAAMALQAIDPDQVKISEDE